MSSSIVLTLQATPCKSGLPKRQTKTTKKTDKNQGTSAVYVIYCHDISAWENYRRYGQKWKGSCQTRQCRTQSCTRWSVWFWKNHSIFAYSRPLYSFPSRHKKPMPGIKAAWNWRQSKNVILQHKTGTILIRLVQQGKHKCQMGVSSLQSRSRCHTP